MKNITQFLNKSANLPPTKEQEAEYYKLLSKDYPNGIPEPEPGIHISLPENEQVGWFVYGYGWDEKKLPFDIRLSEEYALFCIHHKKDKNDDILKLFLKYAIANITTKELYWFEYVEYLKEMLSNPNRMVKPVFADFLIPNAKQIAHELIPLIQREKGKGIALYMLALQKMGVLSFSTRKPVYDSLNLKDNQCTGANDIINKHNLGNPDRSKEIEIYQIRIQNIIDSISK